MALVKTNLALMAYNGAGSGGHRDYYYENPTPDDVLASDYFNELADQIGTGDVIVDSSNGGRYLVTNTSGDIALAEITDTTVT